MSDETKFTRGPWHFRPRGHLINGAWIIAENGTRIANVSRGADKPTYQKLADGLLIAAAPELYAELDRLRAYIASPLCLSDHAREADRRKVLIAGAETALSRARTAEVE